MLFILNRNKYSADTIEYLLCWEFVACYCFFFVCWSHIFRFFILLFLTHIRWWNAKHILSTHLAKSHYTSIIKKKKQITIKKNICNLFVSNKLWIVNCCIHCLLVLLFERYALYLFFSSEQKTELFVVNRYFNLKERKRDRF